MTSSPSKTNVFRDTTPLRSYLPPNRLGVASFLGSPSRSVSRASAEGSEPSFRFIQRVQIAKQALARCKNHLVKENEALDAFLKNNDGTLSDALELANFDSNEKKLQRNVARAERDVAEAELKVLEEKDADAGQLARAKE